MKSLCTSLLAVFILALLALACSLGGRGAVRPDQETTPMAVFEATPTVRPSPSLEPATRSALTPPGATPQARQSPPSPTPVAKESADRTDLDLENSMSGLENLGSYRAAYRFDWKGTKWGQPVSGYMQMRSAFVREPPAQEFRFESQDLEAGADQGVSQVAIVQIGNTAWFYEGQSDTWMQVPAGNLDFARGLFFKPEDLLSNLAINKGRRDPLPQEVNGISCYRYTFDDRDIDPDGLGEGRSVMRARGQVWVAAEGGYVVSLVIDADVRYTAPEEILEEGSIKMTFDISDVNQPIRIEPPTGVYAETGGREDIPMLPDARVDFSSPDLISYQTDSSVADAASFYLQAMPKYGWTAGENHIVLDKNAVLDYNKNGEIASIVIASGENKTQVLISFPRE